MIGDLTPFSPEILVQAFLEHGDLGVIGLDAAGHVRLWNDWIAVRTGVPQETAVGRRLVELFDPPPTRLWAVIQQELTGGLPRVLSPVLHAGWLPFTTPARQMIHLLPVFGQAGKVTGILLLVNDVTAQLQYEERIEAELRAREQRYRTLVEQAADGIFLADPQGNCLDVNPRGCALLGYTREEILRLNIRDLIAPESQAERPIMWEELRSGKTIISECLTVRKDGSRLPVEISARMLDNGNLQGIVRDITERKQAEAKIQEYVRHLSLLNEMTRAVLATPNLPTLFQTLADQLAALLNADGCYITFWDDAQQRVIPMAAFGAHRDTYREFRPPPGERTMTESVLQAGHALVADDVFHSPYISPRIAERFPACSMLGLPLIAGDQKLGAALIAFDRPHHFTADEIARGEQAAGQIALAIARAQLLDQVQRYANELEQRVAERTAELSERVAEVEQLNRRLAALLEDLRAANRQATETAEQLKMVNAELEAFTYSVSHDLKAPLRGIDGYSRLLLEDYADRLDEDGRRFLSQIRRATNQMNQLIEDLLAYSRLERRPLSSGPINPAALVASVVAERSEEMRSRGVRLTVDVPCTTAIAEAEGVIVALRNLLDNALKFTRHVPQPEITIGGRETETSCILWVTDNGPGFDMKYHDRIFEIFQRLHRQEEYPGTGIGLAIVRKAMQRMGGRAWAESQPGKGATFYLEIPR